MYNLILKCEITVADMERLNDWINYEIEEKEKPLEKIIEDETQDFVKDLIDCTIEDFGHTNIFNNIEIVNEKEITKDIIENKIKYFKDKIKEN